jgi:flagellar biosynthesis/type III secretory pathway protein FliH
MNMQTSKFEFKDLKFGDHHFVSAPASDNLEENRGEMINEAITEHLNENVLNVPLEQVVNRTTNVAETTSYNEEELAKAKSESYNQGKLDAENELRPQIQEVEADKSFNDLIKTKMEAVAPKVDLQEEVMEMISKLLSTMAKKLHLSLNTNFDSIINEEILPILNKYYKNGAIILRIHPDRVDYCKKLFKMGELPQNISENIKIAEDDSISKNDCRVEMNDASLLYSQEELAEEAEKILDHLKTNN